MTHSERLLVAWEPTWVWTWYIRTSPSHTGKHLGKLSAPETLKAQMIASVMPLAAVPIFRHYDIANVIHSSSDGQKLKQLSQHSMHAIPEYFGLNKGVVANPGCHHSQ